MTSPLIAIDQIYGSCPVQADGSVDGTPFYFRARGSSWTLSLGSDPVGKPDWCYREAYGDEPYAAGWMSEEEARAFILKAAELHHQGHPGNVQ